MAAGLRARLDAGETLRGVFAKLPGLAAVDCLARSGLDLAVVDMEHSQLAEGEAHAQLAYARALGFPCLVRVPRVDAGAIGRYLEAGACGIQLADTTSRAQADALVRAGRFPPEGERGVSTTHAGADYGRISAADYVSGPESRPLLVVQVERGATADPLERIAAAAIDVCFVGVVDLSVDLGIPGDLASPRLAARLAEVAEAAEAAEVHFGHHLAGPLEPAPTARFITVGADLTVLADGLRRLAGA